MTLEAWVKPNSLNNASAVIMKERPGDLAYALYAANSGLEPPASYIDVSGTDYEAITNSNLPTGGWSFLTATYDGSTLRLYVNGSLQGSLGVVGSLATSSNALRIGGNSVWGEYFNGLIDGVRVYSRPLNLAEIHSDMSTPVGGSTETTSPTVSLSGPAPGATVSGATTLSAAASDATVVTGVQFLLNGRPIGAQVTKAPYTLVWDSRTVANGTYTLSAQAFNGAGLSTTSSAVTVTVNNPVDTVPPTVKVTIPPGATSASGVTVLGAVAADNIGVTGVQFQLNGVNVGPLLTAAPYRLAYDFSSTAAGAYSLTAVAQDSAGNQTASAPLSLTIDHTPPAVLSATPPDGSTGVSTASTFAVTFSKSIQPSTLGVTLKDPSGNAIPVTVNYDDTSHTATFSHGTVALDPLTAYTATVSGVRDLAGNLIAQPFTWSFSTGNAIAGATIWAGTTTPALADTSDASAVEVGVKFRSDVAGVITGLRFYKGPQNTGTHVGHLWSSTGTLLGSVTFTNETATGWQQATFSSPIAITANTTYIASYFAPVGQYASDAGYFATASVNSGPLHALQDGMDGGNGLYHYGAGGGFPGGSFNSTNYWVDVVFNSTTQSTTPPTVTGESPLPNATAVAPNSAVAVTFSKSVQASTINFTLLDGSGNPVAGAVAYNSGTNTATFTPSANLSASTTYAATVSGVQDLAGNVLAQPFTWSFTTANPSAPPAVSAETPAPGATGVGKSAAITATFSKPVEGDTISFVLKDGSGNVVPGTVTFDDESNIATLTPSSALAAGTTYTATVSGATDLSGNVMAAPFSWSFTTAFAVVGDTIWSPTAAPLVASTNDTSAVEVGVKFQSEVAGVITGLRFYKGGSNTGTHVGHLWSDSGTLLATVTFSGESASGWQQANFSNPVNIAANTTYIASYYAPVGGYSADANYFASAGADNAPLHALANGVDGGNGVYHYGTGGGFPGGSFNSTNYWVDVVFQPASIAPTVTAETPAPGATNVSTGTVTATFSEAVQASTINFTVQDGSGNNVAGTVSYNSSTNTATFTPTAALNGLTTYTATVSGATDAGGNAMAAPFSWSFTTQGITLFSAAATPAIAAVNDPYAVELGARFFSDVNGFITGLRFYKGPGNTGTHVGHLWTASGQLLASATFTNETATGWQQVNFNTPVAITSNTLYVASYYAPNGDYAASSTYFATAGVDSGVLHAPATGANGGNGLYAYGTGGAFPSNSYNSTNYWVDVVFGQTTTDTTAPTVTAVTPTNGATAALTSAPITVTFSKDVLASSISLVVTDPSGNAVAGNLAYNGTTKVATFTPSSPLASSVTYTVTVSGVKDLSGNAMAAPYTWSFTTGKAWTQTTVADFSTGTNNGTEVTNVNGGEVTLAPLLEDHFAGSSLNGANWNATSWAPYGGGPTSVTVANNTLSLAGAEVLSAQQYSNTAVEGNISFSAPYQHFGLATDLSSAGGNYWAIFSTGGTSNTLYARVNANGATTDVSLGALPSGFHNYKIQPTATGFQFYVDGALQTTIGASFQASVPLKAALSSFGATALQASLVKFDSYSTTQSGTFTSEVFNAGASVNWGNVSWTATLPTGTSITVQVSVGNTPTPDSSWSAWMTLANNSSVGQTGQYIQYRIILTTTVASAAPSLDDITFSFV
jgi:methionine-rich copper-binding protein CopC